MGPASRAAIAAGLAVVSRAEATATAAYGAVSGGWVVIGAAAAACRADAAAESAAVSIGTGILAHPGAAPGKATQSVAASSGAVTGQGDSYKVQHSLIEDGSAHACAAATSE